MVPTKAQEINEYLQHGDISLAVRRMLDWSLESNDSSLMEASINWSNKLDSSIAGNDYSPSFIEEGYQLVQKASALKEPPAFVSKPLVKATAITKKYSSGNFSMKPVDVSLFSGKITGIVGENGNGKTTLLRCLAGQLAIDNGSIEYSLLHKPDYYDIKHHVAFIPQRIPRWYGRLKDNLHFSAAISGLKGQENERMVAFMLQRLGLGKYAGLSWEQISSGYRTRFELARILLQKPQLLILDEPLANLDIKAQQTVLTDLQFLVKSARYPMGIILSSQQLHEVEKVADEVLFISNGQTKLNSKSSLQQEAAQNVIIEIETTASRESIAQVLADMQVNISFNGGCYNISSPTTDAAAMLAKLLEQHIPIVYFRDITHSAKRFFY